MAARDKFAHITYSHYRARKLCAHLMEKIGLIAGNRRFPLVLAQAAKKKGYYIVAIAIKHDTLRQLKDFVNKIYWLGLEDFRRIFEIFKKEGVTDIVFAGQISPRRLFSKEIELDEDLRNLLAGIKDKKADTIFGAVANRLKESGLKLLDSTSFIKDLLPGKGTLTLCEPDSGVWEDIHFGLNLARAIADLDIGQAVGIKQRAIVAVEALEGTDNLIRRAGKIARGGFTIVKVAKPRQDMRFDVPVVGLNTVKNLISAGAKCLAIEADKTLFLDKEKSLALAQRHGIAIVAV